MKISNHTLLKFMNIVFWVIFIALCIKTSALLGTFLYSLYWNPGAANELYEGLDLYALLLHDKSQYIQTVSFLIVLGAQKTYIAYLVIKFSQKFQLNEPFTKTSTKLFMSISHVSLGAGFLAILAEGHSRWMVKGGLVVPIDWGGSEILFFAGVIYILALVFKKGTQLQLENDLTV